MRRPAVFFDRDNTLIIGNDYLGDPAGVVLVAGAPAAVALCRQLGYAVVVVSNQSGVARGMFDENAVAAVNRAMDDQLLAANPAAVIDRHEYCPHHPQGTVPDYAYDCICRKPLPGMVLRAADAMALDLPASWMVGDAPRDIAAGQAAGCRTILIIDKTLPPSPAARASMETPPDFTVGSLVEAVDVILQETNRSSARHDDAYPPNAEADPSPATEQRATPLSGLADDHDHAESQADVASIEPPAEIAPPSAPIPTMAIEAPRPVGDFRPPAAVPPVVAPLSESSVPRPADHSPANPPAASVDPAPAAAPKPVLPPPVVLSPVDDLSPTARLFNSLPSSAARSTAAEPTVVKVDLARLETTNQQILMELKKLNDIRHDDFSISKLIAGITQTLALAALPLAYVLYRNDAAVVQAWLMTAIFLQAFTVALLMMGRQR